MNETAVGRLLCLSVFTATNVGERFMCTPTLTWQASVKENIKKNVWGQVPNPSIARHRSVSPNRTDFLKSVFGFSNKIS